MHNESEIVKNEAEKSEIKNKQGKSFGLWACLVLFILLGVIATMFLLFSPMAKYRKANRLIDNKQYSEAISVFEEIKDYKNSKEKILLCQYEKALVLMEAEDYQGAKDILLQLGSYKKASEKMRTCNHMILYNHILENGTEYEDSYTIENPESGLLLQIKKDDTTIRSWFEYYIDDSVSMSTIFAIPMDTDEIEISYFLELGTMNFQGDGIFYPDLYDGTLDHTEGDGPEGKVAISSQEKGITLWIDDVNNSPYLDINYNNSDNEDLDEFVALQYYVDFEFVLKTLSEHIEYLDCDITISDFGVQMK